MTKKRNIEWSPGSVLQILQNERHCGDVLSRKTWTPSYLDHKPRRNKHNKPQYRYKNHHEAIVSRDDFIAVSHLISNAKYGSKGILPELQVISEGALRGFVSINPRWAAFTSDDYIRASRSVGSTDLNASPGNIEIIAQSGDFDLRGYEIARSQFFDTVRKACVTFSITELKFGIECIRKMDNIPSVELLLYPDEYLLAVRPAKEGNRNAVRWTTFNGTGYQPRIISGTAFLKTVYDIFSWRTDCKYRVRGIRKQNAQESVYLFDMREVEVFIPSEQVISDDDNPADSPQNAICSVIKPIITTPKTVCAYPADWASSFGSDFYRHAQEQEIATFTETGEWNTQSEGKAFNEKPLQVTGIEDIKTHIDQIIADIKRKGK